MRCDRSTLLAFLVGAVTVISFGGCRGRGLLPPAGPMLRQQAQATVTDPFPQGDIAPGDLGARPPDYQQPLPEPRRNRIYYDEFLRQGP